MKYWRGYLVAAIVAACTWGLSKFAESHWRVVDMVYPYVTRMVQSFLADWSAGTASCLWQVLFFVLIGAGLASLILMIVLHWNPVQWLGWVLAAVSVVSLLNTGLYGLNAYAAPLADDIRLTVTDYALTELQNAALYYRDMANKTAPTADRDSGEGSHTADFDTLAQAAGEGFRYLTHQEFFSAFAGSVAPVKKLGWSGYYTAKGETGAHYPLTGEAAVNPKTPAAGLPFAMCTQMARRMCIANEQDAVLAAFMACRANSRVEFQYSAYFMAYRYCLNSLSGIADDQIAALRQGESEYLKKDIAQYEDSFAVKADNSYADPQTNQDGPARNHVTDLLVSLYIQEIVLPQQLEDTKTFDPMDESQVDLTGLPNAKVPANG